MQKHTTWLDEIDPIDTGIEHKTVEIYPASDVDARINQNREMILRQQIRIAELEERIAGCGNLPPAVWREELREYCETKYRSRIVELENALRSIANNSCCDGCQEAKRVASSALMETESQ